MRTCEACGCTIDLAAAEARGGLLSRLKMCPLCGHGLEEHLDLERQAWVREAMTPRARRHDPVHGLVRAAKRERMIRRLTRRHPSLRRLIRKGRAWRKARATT